MTASRVPPTIHYWLPLWIWIGAILAVSSLPGPALDRVGLSLSDKLAHGLEYAVLGFLAYRRQRFAGASGPLTSWILALALGAVVGAADESYQLLIPGRLSGVGDWTADLVGSATGALVGLVYYAVLARRKSAATGGSEELTAEAPEGASPQEDA